jgi:hypothetical protein
MITRIWVTKQKRLNTSWRRVSEGVDALIIVACNEHDDTRGYQVINEGDICRVEVLIFVYYEMLDAHQLPGVEGAGRDILHTLPDNFPRKDIGIQLSPRRMKTPVVTALRTGYWRRWKKIAWRAPLSCAAEGFEILANQSSSAGCI